MQFLFPALAAMTDVSGPDVPYVEYHVIRLYRHGYRQGYYLSGDDRPVGSLNEANWFSTATEARRKIKRLPMGMGLFAIEHVIEPLDVPPPPGPCPALIKRLFDEIPQPYSLTAAAWYDGVDLKKAGPIMDQPLSRSSFYRHRRKLLDHGIDIARKCNVHILHYRWDQIRQR